VVPAAVQPPAQHGCPAPPQIPQAPCTQVKPPGQSVPSGTQVPGSPAVARAQQPPSQRLRAQHGWPGPPHVVQVGAPALLQVLPAAHAGWPRINGGRQDIPAVPQPHAPAVQMP
jgi:hypothetical protein